MSVVNHRDVVISIGKILIEQGNVFIALYFACKMAILLLFLFVILVFMIYLRFFSCRMAFFDHLVKNLRSQPGFCH
ncbi:hypothetical protein C1Y43_09790 [Pantoea sp. ICBG 828]|nr:hypothetical protein C1Y43_09790 [Pantoea sp. ICBG 828]